MDFLDKNYKMASTDNYTKFEQGENKIRILTPAITGWEYWVDADGKLVDRGAMAGEGGKPVRVEDFKELAGKPEQYEAVEFWAFIVYNYNADRVQILQIKQKTIMVALKALTRSKDWGDPSAYDVAITKTGEKKETRYSVMPSPKSKFVEDDSRAKDINLAALYAGDDPFDTLTEDVSEEVFEQV